MHVDFLIENSILGDYSGVFIVLIFISTKHPFNEFLFFYFCKCGCIIVTCLSSFRFFLIYQIIFVIYSKVALFLPLLLLVLGLIDCFLKHLALFLFEVLIR